MARHVSATFIDPARMRVEARGRRGVVAMDSGSPDGDGSAISPREVVLAALAGCSSMDVASVMRKKRQVMAAYTIEVDAEEATDYPQLYTAITIEHRVTGDVEIDALRRAIELSATRYCPVSAMLSASVRIEHWYRLTVAEGQTTEALVAVTGPKGSQVL